MDWIVLKTEMFERKFSKLDKSIQKLRATYKVHPEWFEVPKPKLDKGKNVVDYSIS